MKLPAWVGGTYQSQSPNAATDRCVNLYPESLETSGEVAASTALYPTPGLELFATAGAGPIRASLFQNGVWYVVSGDQFGVVSENGVWTSYGTVAVNGEPATISLNGNGQIFIVSGGNGYIGLVDFPNTVTQISDPAFPTGRAKMGTFSNGYFLVLVADSSQFQASILNDGTQWNGLDVAIRQSTSDHLMAINWFHEQLWLIGNQTTQVWIPAPANRPPYLPQPGLSLDQGCAASWSVAQVDGALMWLSQNVDGARMALRVSGQTATRISTHAVEYAWSQYPSVDDAIGYGYQDQGHTFYVVTFPNEAATWVYDAATGLWHERAAWDSETGQYVAQRAVNHVYGFGKHLVGDRENGNLYEQSIAFGTDSGGILRRLRCGIHLNQELTQMFHSRFTLDLESGLGAPFGPDFDPQVMLRYSNDGGHTWSSYLPASMGLQGQYGLRVFWTRLGRARNRVYEVSSASGIPLRSTNAYVDVNLGTS